MIRSRSAPVGLAPAAQMRRRIPEFNPGAIEPHLDVPKTSVIYHGDIMGFMGFVPTGTSAMVLRHGSRTANRVRPVVIGADHALVLRDVLARAE
jgi:hypothetical protein